jgi:hypothetical protein
MIRDSASKRGYMLRRNARAELEQWKEGIVETGIDGAATIPA